MADLETLQGRNGSPLAPFLRATLSNGARVLLKPNPTLPAVTVQLWVATGAAHEPPEVGGISHFFEHMYFRGSERFGPGVMDRLVKESGGYNNAATSLEYTFYYIVTQKESFGAALEVLADSYLHPLLDPAAIDAERQVIKEEIRRKEDTPSQKLLTTFLETVFHGTSYARPVLGTPESLDRIGRTQFLEYLAARYSAQNLRVVIAGDIEPALALAEVERQLGGHRGSLRPPAPLGARPDDAPRQGRVTKDVEQLYMVLGYPTPGRMRREQLEPLHLLATALGSGRSSLLYRRLREDKQLVLAISSWSWDLAAAGVIGVDAVLPPQHLEPALDQIQQLLAEVRERGLPADELERARTIAKSEFVFENETNAQLAETLGQFEVLYGDAAEALEYLPRLEAVTAAQVREVAAEYFDPKLMALATLGPSA
ncbi:MAG TPA: pitrilysin family protein [Acidobacteriota bacterium]